MNTSALNEVSDPSTEPTEYAAAAEILSKDLMERAITKGAFPLVGIHAVAAVADYQLVLEPSIKLLRDKGYAVAVSCLWPISDVVVEGVVDSATISMALSEKKAAQMPQLLVMAQSIGTVTELEAILTHVLFDMGDSDYKQIIVLSLVSHVYAEQHLEGILPEKYRGKLLLLDHRRDHELSIEGVLKPGIGGRPIDRAGFLSCADSRSFVPAAFRDKYDFKKRPKPGAAPSPPTPTPFG